MGYFETHARQLIANGYLVIPIKQGHKRPAISAWQNARLSASDVHRHAKCGVGVLTGQGDYPLVALDVDTLNANVADEFVAWCETHLGMTVMRVGNAPKILLVYRSAEPSTKLTGDWFTDGEHKQRLEVLGNGQQFVAYHTHPDTQKPYEWVDLLGGIENTPAACLTTVTPSQLADAFTAFEQIALKHGLQKINTTSTIAVSKTEAPPAEQDTFADTPVGLSLDEAKAHLTQLDAHDYDTWLKMGMALHHEFNGAADAWGVWDDWSATASNYAGSGDTLYRWDGFAGGGVTARTLIKQANSAKQDHARREKRQVLDKAKDLIKHCGDSISLIEEVAPQVGKLVGDDLTLRPEVEACLRSKYKTLTKATLSTKDAKLAIDNGNFKYTPDDKRSLSEFGNAERMLDKHGKGLMYVPETNQWYRWNGVYWQVAMGVDVEHLAKETIRTMHSEGKDIADDEKLMDFYKHCVASQKAQMVKNMITLAQSDPRVVVNVGELDKDKNLLGVGNGTVCLTTGELQHADPKDRITVVTAVEYDADAKTPLFEKTVHDVFFGDVAMINFFQRLIGYTLLGQPNEDIFSIPYGSGSNGKSTVIGAIRDVLGDHAIVAEASTFLGKAGSSAGGAREDVLRLRGKRMVYITEPDEGSELKEGLVKAMTGGEPMPARGLYSKSTIEVMPTWVAFMPTNHKPIVKGDDYAIWRRLLPVPFTRNFDQDNNVTKDPDRADKLKTEASGILAWCVQGALKYLATGLEVPAKVQQARDDYKKDMDLLAEWLEECCEVAPDVADLSSNLWASWEQFARERGELFYVRSARALGKKLASRGFSAIQHAYGIKGRGFLGVRVAKTANAADFESDISAEIADLM